MSEDWKIVIDYPNYKVSNLGNVKNEKKNKMMTQHDHQGYKVVFLYNDKVKNQRNFVHVLVAKAFIENPENKKTVNHKDHNKTNNNLENLEWATHKEQNNHKRKPKTKPSKARPVWRIDKDTKEKLERYSSINKAIDWLDKNKIIIKKSKSGAVISKACRGKSKTAYGFKWIYDDIEHFENEEWKDIPSEFVDGNKNYKISNYGRFKFVNGKISNGHKLGDYLVISIKYKSYRIHRLIAYTFLENPDNKNIVNHKDGNKLNNKVENLEWCTQQENVIHSFESGLRRNNENKIVCLDIKGNILKIYNSQVEASNDLNIDIHAIRNCCDDRYKTVKNYIFKFYKEDGNYDITQNLKPKGNGEKRVIQYTKDGKKIQEFSSITEASEKLNLGRSGIGKCCNGKVQSCGNFKFAFV